MINIDVLELMLRFAGGGQIVLMLAMTSLPRWLDWKSETAKLGTLTRQVFWIYAGYIFATNLFLGALTLMFARELLNATPLTNVLLAFMLLYWGARLILQLLAIDKKAAPSGRFFELGEKALTLLFAYFAATYAAALAANLVL